MSRGWWTITYEAVEEGFTEPSEASLEHISSMIKEGYLSGGILEDDEEEEDQRPLFLGAQVRVSVSPTPAQE